MKRIAILLPILILVGALFPVDVCAEGTALEKIPIGKNLRLDKSFDYSTYYGVINSREELAQIWSHIIKAGDDDFFFPGMGVPPPPEFDFKNHQALWFADRGAHASFVESAELVEDAESGALTAAIKVWHSDFGSRKLNLWKIPRTNRKIIFRETHHYDRGP